MADEGGEAVQEVELVIDTSQPQVITVDADVAPADQPPEPPASPSVHEQPAPEVAAEPTPEAAPPAEAAEAAPPAEGTPPAEPAHTAEAAQTTESSPESAPPAEPVPGSEEPAHEATAGEPEPSGDVAPVIIPSKISAAKHTSEVAMSRSKQSQESGKNLQTVSFEKIQSDTKIHSTTTADLAKKSSTVQYERLSRKVTSKCNGLQDMDNGKRTFIY